jgi:Zn-dependent protease with chaperone function
LRGRWRTHAARVHHVYDNAMTNTTAMRQGLLKALLFSALALFMIPAITYSFVRYAERQDDKEFMFQVQERAYADPNATAEEKEAHVDFYRKRPLSTICASTEAAAQRYRESACEPYGETWQFHVVRTVSFWTLVGGVVVLLAISALGALAFVNRQWQYLSFVVGWRLMTLASAAEVVLQGSMAVWLSFWGTVFFTNKYYIKLILVVGVLVLAGVGLLLMRIFQKVPLNDSVEGELVAEADAPLLWRRIRQMAARLKTAPPDHIVAGIDTNFFVTEVPVHVGTQRLTGRTLFVSIPLLRVLSMGEADAVLGHELAHFRGGDTRNSALLGPKLNQYDHYLQGLSEATFTLVVLPFMQLYRMVFQLSLSKDSREREFKADRIASKLVSPQGIVNSLIKISAYDHYRSHTENALFSQDQKLSGALGISEAVARGLKPYAASDDFFDDMRTAHIPHPYDSHPPLKERMRHVGHVVEPDHYGAIVQQTPTATWADDIITSIDIEQRLWAKYEERFAQNHELALAYRFEPANDQEREAVLKFFPPVVFKLKHDKQVEVSIDGIEPTEGDSVHWDDVKALKYNESSFGDSLTVTLNDKGLLGNKTLTVKLPGMGKQKDDFNAALGHFWHRQQVMRSQQ